MPNSMRQSKARRNNGKMIQRPTDRRDRSSRAGDKADRSGQKGPRRERASCWRRRLKQQSLEDGTFQLEGA